MKKNILLLLFAAIISAAVVSCSEKDLSDTSAIKDAIIERNDFDIWIEQNYTAPYNIEVLYRMKDIESDMNYNLTPANFEKSVQLAKLTLYLCVEAYDEITGDKSFIKAYFPKILNFIGSSAVRNNGTEVIGTAEGGRKITLYAVNTLNISNMAHMNQYFFKTQHHEFAHILNQTKPYTTDFKAISGSKYVGDSWNTAYNSTTALQAGFISPYASSSDGEDFVELICIYVTNSISAWNTMLTTAGTTGRPIINAKFDIVKTYMLNSWDIDLDQLRDAVQRRQGEIHLLGL